MASKRVKTNFPTKENQNQNASVAVDRISRLPDPIILHILSFVPTIDVVRMSLLSKRWRRVWYSIPSLNFSDADIWRFRYRRRKSFYKFVHKFLKHREAGMRYISDSVITRFKFDVEFCGGSSALDNCLSFAIWRNIEEFDLRAKPKFKDKLYCGYCCLPEAVLNARPLVVLKLDSLKLNGSCSVTLPSLKSLSLTAVKLDDHMLKSLLLGCPSVEKFNLKECIGLLNPIISSLSIKFMEIATDCKTVRVEATNVESLVYSGFCADVNLSACKAIKSLSLLTNWLDDQSLEDIIFELPLLETLNLSRCYELKHIKICGHHLKSVSLEKVCNKAAELLVETPNQVSFSYKGDTRFILRMKSTNLPNGNFIIDRYDNYDSNWYVGLIMFLSNINFPWNHLNLHVFSEEALTIPEDLRRICRSPWPNLKDLKVKTCCSVMKKVELRDALYWLSPSLETLAIQQEEYW